jgi:hypothetical protein
MGAFITVSDATGRVLLRRPATDEEVLGALWVARTAENESRAGLERIARDREAAEFGEDHEA